MADNIISLKASADGTTLTKVKIKGFEYEIDEPAFFGGRDLAPSPVDYLLGSIAGCISAIGTYMAKEMGFTLRHLDIAVDGLINSDLFFGISEKKRSGFQKIDIRLTIDSDATPEQLKNWKEQLLTRCPVIDNLLHPVEITVKESEEMK